MRGSTSFFAFALALLMAMPVEAVTKRHTHPYRREWKRKTFGKNALIGVGAGVGIAHARNSPHEWGQGAAGLAKRGGFGFANHAVKTTVEHAVAAPLHEDLHYHRSRSKKFLPRLRHALVSTVVTRNTHTHKHQPAIGRVSGHAASGAFSAAVLPAASGAATAGIGLGASAGANVAREFWPRHHAHGKKPVHTAKRHG